jgi:hypothetical protein
MFNSASITWYLNFGLLCNSHPEKWIGVTAILRCVWQRSGTAQGCSSCKSLAVIARGFSYRCFELLKWIGLTYLYINLLSSENIPRPGVPKWVFSPAQYSPRDNLPNPSPGWTNKLPEFKVCHGSVGSAHFTSFGKNGTFIPSKSRTAAASQKPGIEIVDFAPRSVMMSARRCGVLKC